MKMHINITINMHITICITVHVITTIVVIVTITIAAVIAIYYRSGAQAGGEHGGAPRPPGGLQGLIIVIS